MELSIINITEAEFLNTVRDLYIDSQVTAEPHYVRYKTRYGSITYQTHVIPLSKRMQEITKRSVSVSNSFSGSEQVLIRLGLVHWRISTVVRNMELHLDEDEEGVFLSPLTSMKFMSEEDAQRFLTSGFKIKVFEKAGPSVIYPSSDRIYNVNKRYDGAVVSTEPIEEDDRPARSYRASWDN